MKVLIFDDNAMNRAAAEAQLIGHDLTVVSTYDEAQNLLAPLMASNTPAFDVVLTDLLVPASSQSLDRKNSKFAGQEMPVGIFIGLLAAVKGHAKFVAVFTDSNHHQHPSSACFDRFNSFNEEKPKPFIVEGSKVLLTNNRMWISDFDRKDLSTALDRRVAEGITDTVRAKNWASLLEYLIR